MRTATRMTGVAVIALQLAGCSSASSSSAVKPLSAAPATSAAVPAGSTPASAPGPAASTPAGQPSSASPAAPAGSTTPGTSTPAGTSSTTPATTTAAPPTTTKPAPTTTTGGGGSGSSVPNPSDPAIKAMNAWFAQVGKAINAKKYDTPGLDALMTSVFRTRLKSMLSSDLGLYYPGPLPSKAISVSSPSPGLRFVQTCDVLSGYAQNAKTHKPAAAFQEVPGEVHVQLQNGRWVLQDWIAAPGGRSCKNVHVPTPSW